MSQLPSPNWYPPGAGAPQQNWSPNSTMNAPGPQNMGAAQGGTEVALAAPSAEMALLQLQEMQNQMMAIKMDPYVFGGVNRPSFLDCIYPFCDWTFLMMILMFLGSVVGVGIVLGDSSKDNIYKAINATNYSTLENAIKPFIKINESQCTLNGLTGSFGSICLEDTLNAASFTLLLSFWNTLRASLWIIAAVFSFLAVVLALLVHLQRHPYYMSAGIMTPEKQMEFLQMSPADQQMFLFQLQQTMMQQVPGCCGSAGVSVYDTPYYAFMRVAWGFSGIISLVIMMIGVISCSTFVSFFKDNTTEILQNFWTGYFSKYIISTVVVGVYLAWPIAVNGVELAVWIIGFLPWLIVRICIKPGIERLRPSLPLSEVPGYIRMDMFFMDFQDIKRLGFSRLQWMILTDSERPFFDCCEDPTIIRDPGVINSMLGGFNMGAFGNARPPGSLAGPQQGQPETHRSHHHNKDENEVGEEAPKSRSHRNRDEGEGESKSRRHRMSRTKDGNGALEGSSIQHRHRSKEGREQSGHRHSGSHRRHSKRNTEEKSPQAEMDALMDL